MRDATLIRNGRFRTGALRTAHSEDADQSDDDFRWQKAFLAGDASVEDYHPSRNNWGP